MRAWGMFNLPRFCALICLILIALSLPKCFIDLQHFQTMNDIPEIEIRPRQMPLGQALLGSAAIVPIMTLVLAFVFQQEGRTEDELGLAILLLVLLSVIAGWSIFQFCRQMPSPSRLLFEPDRLRWQHPSGPGVELPYRDLWAAYRTGRGQKEVIVLKGREKPKLVLPVAAFVDPARAATLLDDVEARLREIPGGAEVAAGMARRGEVAARISRPGPATLLLLAILILFYGIELATGALEDEIRLLALGANSYPLVHHGDFFRLAVSNLLHGNLFHLAVNGWSLVVLGTFLERLIGASRFLTIFLFSCLTGAAASAFPGLHPLAVGASTGLCGLVIAYAVVHWRWPDALPVPPVRPFWRSIALVFLLPALMIRQADNFGHIGGALGGLLVCCLALTGSSLLDLQRHRRTFFQATAVGLAALFAGAVLVAGLRYRDPSRDLVTAVRLLTGPPRPEEALANNLAWFLATHPAASPTQLAAARTALHRIIRDDSGPAIVDTWATLCYRLGDFDTAVRAEAGLLRKTSKPSYASQLARFELALAEARGPLSLGPSLSRAPRAQVEPGGIVTVDLGDPSTLRGAILHFVLARGRTPVALLELNLGQSPSPLFHLGFGAVAPPPDGVRAVLALADTRAKAGMEASSRFVLRQTQPSVMRLP